MDLKYEGWTNSATYLANQYITQDKLLDSAAVALARLDPGAFTGRVLSQHMPPVFVNQGGGNQEVGLCRGRIRLDAWAQGDINWNEIANTILEDHGLNGEPLAYVVIQEGGSSHELYVHTLDNESDANDYRLECVTDGAYRTSPSIGVPARLANQPGFHDAVERLVRATLELDLPDVVDMTSAQSTPPKP